jgi:hypothetical protein
MGQMRKTEAADRKKAIWPDGNLNTRGCAFLKNYFLFLGARAMDPGLGACGPCGLWGHHLPCHQCCKPPWPSHWW